MTSLRLTAVRQLILMHLFLQQLYLHTHITGLVGCVFVDSQQTTTCLKHAREMVSFYLRNLQQTTLNRGKLSNDDSVMTNSFVSRSYLHRGRCPEDRLRVKCRLRFRQVYCFNTNKEQVLDS